MYTKEMSRWTSLKWPYHDETRLQEELSADVLVLGGGLAGCSAAIAAAQRGVKVIMVEKGATERSGAAGSGFDHWGSAVSNPCSEVTPEEQVQSKEEGTSGYCNSIAYYVNCRENYDRLLDIEKMGGKIRDSEGEFEGADFRDPETGLLFAFDYDKKTTLRVWGSGYKPVLYRECKRLGVLIKDRIMATSILTEGGKQGAKAIGATGFDTRTGKFYVFNARSVVLSMARPSRVWYFSGSLPGVSDFRPLQCSGDGHVMAWKAGAELTMMEVSSKGAHATDGRCYPPYGSGNANNTWYACSIVDSTGREVPWVDQQGNIISDVSQRYRPVSDQKFRFKTGLSDTVPFEQLIKEGYKPPFFADLSRMPEMERKVIWGMMVGEESKTKVPIFKTYTEAGFDPERHLLQVYGTGWFSGEFLPKERQFFSIPFGTGGLVNNWQLRTTMEGLYGAGDNLFFCDGGANAITTGYYAGRHAAKYASTVENTVVESEQVECEKSRIYAPLHSEGELGWKEMNKGIVKIMQEYCGETKTDTLLKIGMKLLNDLEIYQFPSLYASNPHDLTRTLEVMNVLEIAKLVIHACLNRKSNSDILSFSRGDSKETDPPGDNKFTTLRLKDDKVIKGELSLDYHGSLEENYEKYNQDYLAKKGEGSK